MGKLTKAEILAAHDELNKEIGFQPAPGMTGKLAEIEVNLYQSILDIELDGEDRKALTKDTLLVVDALAKKYPKMVATPEEEAPKEEKKTKEKKVKKEKAPKAKKEKAPKTEEVVEDAVVVEEEKPAKTAKTKKAAKGKTSKVDPAVLAEELKANKKITKAEMLEFIDEHADLLGDEVAALKAITNPMSLKKQIRTALEGGEVVVTAPKKREKKAKTPKVVELTLTEKVNAFQDLDDLKAFAKENKDAFPGVKAKKFDKIKKLRKAMLEVIVEVAPKGKKEKKAKKGATTADRIAFITTLLEKEPIKKKDLMEIVCAEFPDNTKSAHSTIISDGKNPKYNKFEKLIVVNAEGMLCFEGTGKKAKSKKAEAEAPKKEKKNKKNKKAKK